MFETRIVLRYDLVWKLDQSIFLQASDGVTAAMHEHPVAKLVADVYQEVACRYFNRALTTNLVRGFALDVLYAVHSRTAVDHSYEVTVTPCKEVEREIVRVVSVEKL